MPVETRRVEFSESELIAAVCEHCRYDRILVPDAAVEALELRDDPERALSMRFRVAHPTDPDEIALTRHQLRAALIRYCGQNGIILPRDAAKEVHLVDGRFILEFAISYRPRHRVGIAA